MTRLYRKSQDLKYLLYGYFMFLLFHFFVYRYVEIYPSLIFPSFSEAPKMNGVASFATLELSGLSTSDQTFEINKEEFFAGLYTRHSTFILNSIIRKQQNKTRKTSSGQDIRKFSIYAQKRLRQMFPNVAFKALVISKQQNKYSFSTKKLTNVLEREDRTLIAIK